MISRHRLWFLPSWNMHRKISQSQTFERNSKILDMIFNYIKITTTNNYSASSRKLSKSITAVEGILFTKKTSWHGSLFHITEPSCFCGQSAANQLCVDVFLLLAWTSCVTKSWTSGNLRHDHMTSVWCWVGIYKNHITLIEIWFPYRSHSWYLP